MSNLSSPGMKKARQAILDGFAETPFMTFLRAADLARPYIPTDGDQLWVLGEKDNVVLGADTTIEFCDLLANMIEQREIFRHFTSPVPYMWDGRALDLPLVAVSDKGLDVDAPHWLPVVFTLDPVPPESPDEIYKASVVALEAMKPDSALVLEKQQD